MPRNYAHDDDLGDWMHEQRKQKALDRRWDEEAEKRRDAEIIAAAPPALHAEIQQTLNMVRYQARAMDTILNALLGPRDFHDDSDTCQRCGVKHRGTGCRCNEERS